MQRGVFIGLATATILGVCGCGGGGGGGSSSNSSANPLIGFYHGSGSESGTTHAIATTMGVASDNTLCGTLEDSTAKTRTLLGGIVSDSGQISEGSVQVMDSKGNTTAAGSLAGQITLLNGQTAAGGASANLTSTTSLGTVTYAFPSLQNVTAAIARARRRRKRSQTQPKAGV